MKPECQELLREAETHDAAQRPWPESLRQRVRAHLDACSDCRPDLLLHALRADARGQEPLAEAEFDQEGVWRRIEAGLDPIKNLSRESPEALRIRAWGDEILGKKAARKPGRRVLQFGLSLLAVAAAVWFFFWLRTPAVTVNVRPPRETLGASTERLVTVDVRPDLYILIAAREKQTGIVQFLARTEQAAAHAERRLSAEEWSHAVILTARHPLGEWRPFAAVSEPAFQRASEEIRQRLANEYQADVRIMEVK